MKFNGENLKRLIMEYPDFPSKGILFRDLNKILTDLSARKTILENVKNTLSHHNLQAIVAAESRGFIWGALIAEHFNMPFIPIRKSGKLPGNIHEEEYILEYGTDVLQIQKDSLKPYHGILIVDDLIATGGTAEACAKLVLKQYPHELIFYFVVELSALNGREKLKPFSDYIYTSVQYD